MRQFLLLLFVSFTVIACSDSKPASIVPKTLTGTWIEKSNRTDTLIFNPTFAGQVRLNMLIVNRGRERGSNGDLVPKLGSGVIYNYELRDNRIYIKGGTSALAVYYANFGIRRKGDELVVDNFFEVSSTQPATATRILVRLP